MENTIKKTTKKLSNGEITKDEADKILLDLFKEVEIRVKETPNQLESRLGFPLIGYL